MSEDYWDGALWVYHADIVNTAGGAGGHSYTVAPAVGSEMEVLYGSFQNGDTLGRLLYVNIDDGTNLLTRLLGQRTVTAGHAVSFPQGNIAVDDQAGLAPDGRTILSGPMTVVAIAEAIAVSQDTAFGIVCRIRGGIPTVALIGPGAAVETVNTNQVM